MSYTVSRAAAGSAVAFFDSIHDRLKAMMAGAPIILPHSKRSLSDSEIRSLVADGHRLDELCRRCGYSDQKILATLRRLGIIADGMHRGNGGKCSKRTKERRARGMALLSEGKTLADVARECGVTKPTARLWQSRLNLNAGKET